MLEDSSIPGNSGTVPTVMSIKGLLSPKSRKNYQNSRFSSKIKWQIVK